MDLRGQLGFQLGLELRLGLRGLGFPSYSPLWCHNDVIIYLALGYEVLRKRKYDHMAHHATLTSAMTS